jgi:hypothetical protein
MDSYEKHEAKVNIDLTGLESKLKDYYIALSANQAGYDMERYETPGCTIRVDDQSVGTHIHTVLCTSSYEADLVVLRQGFRGDDETERWYVARRYPSDLDFTIEQHYYQFDGSSSTASEILAAIFAAQRP